MTVRRRSITSCEGMSFKKVDFLWCGGFVKVFLPGRVTALTKKADIRKHQIFVDFLLVSVSKSGRSLFKTIVLVFEFR